MENKALLFPPIVGFKLEVLLIISCDFDCFMVTNEAAQHQSVGALHCTAELYRMEVEKP